MSFTVYVPRDASALSLGAEAVAHAVAAEAARRNIDIKVVRNGSRGLYWLEPMVEVATPEGRVAYGPVQKADIKALFDANFFEGGKHALSLGLTEEIDFLKNQQRLTFARVGIVDPRSLDDYRARGLTAPPPCTAAPVPPGSRQSPAAQRFLARGSPGP